MNRLTFSTLGCPEKSFDEILSTAAKFGFADIELRGILDKVSTDTVCELQPALRAQTTKKLDDAGISIKVLGCSAKFHGEHASALAEIEFASAAAAELGIPYLRVFGDKCKNDDMFLHVADGLKKACKIAKSRSVTLLLETHGEFNFADRLNALLDEVDEPELGLIWDVAHTHRAGEDPEKFAERMLPRIKHVHFKDVNTNGALCLPGEGVIDLGSIYDKLLSLGYTGLFSLEWERRWHPELPALEEALDKYIRIFEKR